MNATIWRRLISDRPSKMIWILSMKVNDLNEPRNQDDITTAAV